MGKKCYIKNIGSGLVITIKDASDEKGGDIVMAPWDGGDHQLWKVKDNMIYSKLNKKLALDLDKTNNRICTYTAHGKVNQKWIFNDDKTIASESNNGEVMDVELGSNDAGARLIPYPLTGTPNQTFEIVDV